ncbi:hypothetical protein J14TS2_41330 [Bacillus sp. J14TS2]|nr:hypothetical protein J14TS2_41330 [Bacillus sp. J14TS2]
MEEPRRPPIVAAEEVLENTFGKSLETKYSAINVCMADLNSEHAPFIVSNFEISEKALAISYTVNKLESS